VKVPQQIDSEKCDKSIIIIIIIIMTFKFIQQPITKSALIHTYIIKININNNCNKKQDQIMQPNSITQQSD